MSGQEEDQDEAGRDPGSQREDNAQPCLHRKSAIIATRSRIFVLFRVQHSKQGFGSGSA